MRPSANATPKAGESHPSQRMTFDRNDTCFCLFCLFLLFLLVNIVAGASETQADPSMPLENIPETIVFGGDANYPPFEWAEDGEANGFNIDLVRAMAAVDGRHVRHRLDDWPDTLKALRDGVVDVVPMFHTAERDRIFEFSQPFYYVHTAAFSHSDSPTIPQLSELERRRVVLEKNSRAHEILLRELEHTAGLVTVENTLAALRAVADGRAQYAIVNAVVAERLIHRTDMELVQAGPPLWSDVYAFAVLPERKALKNWLDFQLSRVVANGTFAELYTSWKPDLEASAYRGRVAAWIAWAMAGVIGLAALSGIWAWSLRQRVSIRTLELRAELHRRERAEARMQYLVQHEPETGLPRRKAFVEAVDRILSGSEPAEEFALVLLRLENVSEVSRTFGPQTGEQMIRIFADRLNKLDTLAVAHFGESTFGLFTAGLPDAAVFRQLSQSMAVMSVSFDVRLAAGLARTMGRDIPASELLRHATTALEYRDGRRSEVQEYHPWMDPDPTDLELVRDFRQTRGEGIRCVYQPQVDLESGECIGCEALARWNHPRLGTISPARFVPLLEQAGLVTILTERMIDHALGCAVGLRSRGVHCPVSVNVSAQDLLESGLQHVVTAALQHHGGQAGDLKLELTETGLAKDPEAVVRMLGSLRDQGIRSSIDDFGTGYSTLAYLSRFPVDEVKIDRIFVATMCNDRRNRAIVHSAITMAHEIGLLVVAEGAEDQDTLDALRAAGCDRVQGYVIARPLEPDELHRFLRSRQEGHTGRADS